jgi:hypothetical protein
MSNPTQVNDVEQLRQAHANSEAKLLYEIEKLRVELEEKKTDEAKQLDYDVVHEAGLKIGNNSGTYLIPFSTTSKLM